MHRPGSPPPLKLLVKRLRSHFGEPEAPFVTDPFQQILLEQVAYLASDETRREAFRMLEEKTGLDPESIRKAPEKTLVAVARKGGSIAADKRASRLRDSAQRVCDDWDGDLTPVLDLPYEKAIRVLTKFAMIGKPGAGKILLLAGATTRIALDSNGLRVLLRVGYGVEDERYDKAYRSVLEAIEAQPPLDRAAAVAAHLLLRELGKTLCKQSSPACGECPLRDACAHHRDRS